MHRTAPRPKTEADAAGYTAWDTLRLIASADPDRSGSAATPGERKKFKTWVIKTHGRQAWADYDGEEAGE